MQVRENEMQASEERKGVPDPESEAVESHVQARPGQYCCLVLGRKTFPFYNYFFPAVFNLSQDKKFN